MTSVRESYEPLYGFRTKFDMALQQTWCANCRCGACQLHEAPTAKKPSKKYDNDEDKIVTDVTSDCSPDMQSGNFPTNLKKMNILQ